MTSDEARLFERMDFHSTQAAHGFINPNIASYFFGNNPYNRTGRERLMVCRMALSELDNDLLATFIGVISIGAALEGRREYCKIVITCEAHSALYHETDELDDY